eukprot:NODE_3488_length_1210_cov_117.202392_g3309_i0.p1 GENE.NODE_3488_length_1210_cov_117.202392_g3309_i0~~NODE_3488_length_1210_cov_117.202392_g3309_i0.p1  ORF type:complete len:377 (-),score=86.33 NODE_3488_length_1210_cov_117.202392_g3309_i0:78-1154(-)
MPAVTKGVVAVTGASGFIGSYIVEELLGRGYTVRAVVRNKDDPTKIEHLEKMAKTLPPGRLVFFNGDLAKDGSYDEAFDGADAVVHSAAVVEIGNVPNPQKTIVDPSVEGTKNVMGSVNASKSVKRLVHTSSVAAIYDLGSSCSTPFSEKDWNEYSTIASGDPYGYAKTQAERLMWKLSDGKSYDVAVVNPAVALGPPLTKAHTKASVVVIRQMLFGNTQPNYYATFVDVRDVAKCHVEALSRPEAASKRFICANPDAHMWVVDLEKPLKAEFPQYQIKGVTHAAWLLKLAIFLSYIPLIGGLFLKPFQRNVITKKVTYDSSESQKTLGMKYRELSATLRDSVNGMVIPGWVKPKAAK